MTAHPSKIIFSASLVEEIHHLSTSLSCDPNHLWLLLCAGAIYRCTRTRDLQVQYQIQEKSGTQIFSFSAAASPRAVLAETLGPSASEQPGVRFGFFLDCDPGPGVENGLLLYLHLQTSPCRPAAEDQDLEGHLLEGQLWYDPHALDDLAAGSLAQHLPVFADHALDAWDTAISAIPLLTAEEHTLILDTWSQGRPLDPVDGVIHQRIREQAQRVPNQIAVACQGEWIRYAQLYHQANLLAHRLVENGIGPEKCVGIFTERSIPMVIGMLAVLKAGATFTAFGPASPEKAVEHILADARVTVLLKQAGLNLTSTPENLVEIILPDPPAWNEVEDLALSEPRTPLEEAPPETACTPSSGALLLYTSGSTGQPKGVLYSHAGFLNRAASQDKIAPLADTDVYGQCSPLSSIDAYDEIFAPLLSGSRVEIIPDRVVRAPRELVKALKTGQVTRMLLVPTLLSAILTLDGPVETDLKNIITWFVGGEPLTQNLVALFYDRLPASVLYNYYGLTEGDAAIFDTRTPIHPACAAVPIGSPAPGIRAFVLDEFLNPLPPGLAGEIHIASLGLSKRYHNRESLTAERFLAHPLAAGAGERLFKTGDLARWLPDGSLEYRGRSDRQVKVRGFTVNLGEVESVLKQHPGVRDGAVVTRTDSAGYQQLAGYAVLASSQIGSRELRAHLKEHLPEYAVPAAIVLLPELPLNPNGKVNSAALPAPAYGDYAHEGQFVPPSDPIEEKLAQIWQNILGLSQVSTQDNFFDLGGNSLRVIALIGEIEREFGRELPMNVFFQAATIASLARLLAEDAALTWSCLVPIQTYGERKPFFCVHADGGVFFYHRLSRAMGDDQPFYGLQARGLDGRETPFTTLQEMAAQYIKEIRSVQPRGPYHIGAFSMGGMVAFEMANQLYAAGEEVALLAMLDAYGPNYPVIPSWTNLMQYKLSTHINSLRILPVGKQINYLWRRTRSRSKKIYSLLAGKLLRILNKPMPRAIRYDEIRRSVEGIINQYTPTPFPGKLKLFRASAQPTGCLPDPYLGWGPLVSGEIEIIEVFASHNSMLKEPHVNELAAKLRASIQP